MFHVAFMYNITSSYVPDSRYTVDGNVWNINRLKCICIGGVTKDTTVWTDNELYASIKMDYIIALVDKFCNSFYHFG